MKLLHPGQLKGCATHAKDIVSLGTNGVFMAEPVSNVIGGGACFITMLATIIPELNKMKQP